jgi:hypothetical protein
MAHQFLVLGGPPPPLDAEFKALDLTSVFSKEGLPLGRCFGSKSGYRRIHPRSIFVPNANVFCRKRGKLWWGDIDLCADKGALERVARRLRSRLYVLSEHDGRWESATLPFDEVLFRAQWHTGGASRVPGVSNILRRSGLTLQQLAMLVKVSPIRLRQRQTPEIRLEVYRRVFKFDEVFREIATDLALKKWGDWWSSANDKLSGKTPLEAYKSGVDIEIANLLGDEAAIRCLGLVFMLQKRL